MARESRGKSVLSIVGIEEDGDEDGLDNVWADDVCVDVGDESPDQSWINFKVLWTYMGPGWLMSIAYLDPGNLEADLQAGAYANYQLLWVLFWCTMIGLLLQILAARLGVVTGRNLAQLCRLEYPRRTSLLLWVMTELAIIGSDIQEVIGGAIALQVLFGLRLTIGTVIMALSTFGLLALQRFGIRKIEALFAVLIFIMICAFWASMIIADPDPAELIAGVVEPQVASYATTQAVGILGAVIMPHNIYLHSALVTSRKIDRRNKAKVAESVKYNAIESSGALFVSFLINLAVVATFAKAFFDLGCAELTDCGNNNCQAACIPVEGMEASMIAPGNHSCGAALDGSYKCGSIGLNNAGLAIENLFPDTQAAKYIWGIGLLAAGQASTITGTFAGQFVMAGFLNFKIKAWQRMFFTRMVALGPAVTVAYLTANHPSASDVVNEYLNVLQSLQLPFALLPVLHLTSSRKYMGEFANGTALKLVCWVLALVVVLVNIYLVLDELEGASTPALVVVAVLGFFYFSFLVAIIRSDLRELWNAITGGTDSADGTAYSGVDEEIDADIGDHYAAMPADQ